MKNVMMTLISLLMLISFPIDPVVAQSSDNKLYLINTTTIKPSKRLAYEKAVKVVMLH